MASNKKYGKAERVVRAQARAAAKNPQTAPTTPPPAAPAPVAPAPIDMAAVEAALEVISADLAVKAAEAAALAELGRQNVAERAVKQQAIKPVARKEDKLRASAEPKKRSPPPKSEDDIRRENIAEARKSAAAKTDAWLREEAEKAAKRRRFEEVARQLGADPTKEDDRKIVLQCLAEQQAA